MTANERYEKAWDSFLVYLNRNSKAQLTPFLKERHVNHRTMMIPETTGAWHLRIAILCPQEQTMQNAVQGTIGHHERNLPKKHEI